MTKARTVPVVLVSILAWAVGGCAVMRREAAKNNGDLLAAAGFTQTLADTPQRQEELQTMPPLKLVAQSQDGAAIVYRYADPYNCHCLYVGDQHAYTEYQRLASAKKIAHERLVAADIQDAGAAIEWNSAEASWWW